MSRRVNLKAISFDGANDYIDVPNSSERFSFSNGVDKDEPFSVTCWVYLTQDPVANSTAGSFVTKSDFSQANDPNFPGLGNGTEWFFRHNEGKLQVFLYDSPPVTSKYLRRRADVATLVANKWSFVAMTYDGSSALTGLELYQFDDANSGPVPATTTTNQYEAMANTETNLTIGSTEELENNPGNPARIFEGKLADICVFDKELSQAEVTEIYNGGAVKDMTKFSAYENLISWWKMGDDKDLIKEKGIKDYKSSFHGTPVSIERFETVPALPSDRISSNIRIQDSWGRTRQPKSITGDHAVYIHGGKTSLPEVDPDQNTEGFVTENQRFLHTYWKAEQSNKTHEITAFGYSYSTKSWSPLVDVAGNEVKLSTENEAVNIYKIFEISGVDKVYFKSTGADSLLSTDLFTAACSTF